MTSNPSPFPLLSMKKKTFPRLPRASEPKGINTLLDTWYQISTVTLHTFFHPLSAEYSGDLKESETLVSDGATPLERVCL